MWRGFGVIFMALSVHSGVFAQHTASPPIPNELCISLNGTSHQGLGTISVQGSTLVMTMPLSTGNRAKGPDNDPDYAIYGTCAALLDISNVDLSQWNSLSLDVSTDLDVGVANINIAFDGDSPSGLGAHLVNVKPGHTEHVDYQFSELCLTKARTLRIYTDLKGRNLSQLDSIRYFINNITLHHLDKETAYKGWQPRPDAVALSMSGYYTNGKKTAVAQYDKRADKRFEIIDANSHEVVFRGKAEKKTSTIGTFSVLDFSTFTTPGQYILRSFGIESPFCIGEDVMKPSEEKVLNFINKMRCGDAVDGIHGKCHVDVFCDHAGKSYTYGGGWHDAGDLSQQTLQTADVAFALMEAYNAHKVTDARFAEALKTEAMHGFKQVLRCRMGNGYHASSIGLLHWTDGIVGTDDDIHTVRKQNLAFDNFLYAAYEAYVALSTGNDELRKAAIEDFDYATDKFAKEGIDTFSIQMEHTYNTSYCTFMAAAAWSASMMHRLTKQARYADLTREYIREVLLCQETEGEYAGFFYRDKSHEVPVHFIHQSRDQLPVFALAAATEHDSNCLGALRRYGNYIKKTMVYTYPYGMLPSGVYKDHEYKDFDSFTRLHLWAPQDANTIFDKQMEEGVRLNDELILRRFPAWFSIFNGNETIMLSTGKAAAICGNVLNDAELLEIAREQLYWTVGKNPFCESLIFGEGSRYSALDNFSSGDIVGAIPVGIRSFGDTDEPYWPMTNNACYKEVWLTSAGKWLSLIAEILKGNS